MSQHETFVIVVMSSDRTGHLLDGFFHQWGRYGRIDDSMKARASMVVCGVNLPDKIPAGWGVYCAGQDIEYQLNWVGHLRHALNHLGGTDLVLLLMDDYWLTKPVRLDGLWESLDYMKKYLHVSKIDLTNDRRGFPHLWLEDSSYIQSYRDAPYITSTQAALWRQKFLRNCLANDAWTPWQFELDGTTQIIQRREQGYLDYVVMGHKEPVMQYANVSLRGQEELRLGGLSEDDVLQLKSEGVL
jgi:hypothetical protein